MIVIGFLLAKLSLPHILTPIIRFAQEITVLLVVNYLTALRYFFKHNQIDYHSFINSVE